MQQTVIGVICWIFRQVFQSGETYNEQGELRRVKSNEDGEERDVIVTKGSYTIIDKDGSTVLVNYTADENGFHPEIGKRDIKWNEFSPPLTLFFLAFLFYSN